MAKLTYAKRKKLRSTQFALPEARAFPIHDVEHARNALARVAQPGHSESERRRVRAAVHRKFPEIKCTKCGRPAVHKHRDPCCGSVGCCMEHQTHETYEGIMTDLGSFEIPMIKDVGF